MSCVLCISNHFYAMFLDIPAPAMWVATMVTYWCMYPLLHTLLMHHDRYKALSPPHKSYVLSNTIKALVLGGSIIITCDLTGDLILRQKWNSKALQLLAPVYANLDVVSLVRVSRMMRSTVVHHILVGLLGALVAFFPVGPGTLNGHVVIYALFSMMAFCVHGFLAYRHLLSPRNDVLGRRAAYACGVGYLCICAVHWGFHALNIWWYPRQLWPIPFVFAPFVYDDVILMRWLFRYSREHPAPPPG